MQNSDESTIRAMKAVAALAQVKSIAEDYAVAFVKAIAKEFKVDESVALRIVEDVAGHKCGEGACKAKEEAQTPAPVSKPAAPEAAPKATDDISWLGKAFKSARSVEAEAPLKATDVIESIESVWSDGTDEVCVGPIWVGPQNRVTIPPHIIELAEDINGKLNRGGALTVIKGDGKVTVLFGDKSAEHEGASVVRLNCKGQAQICVSPAFTDGDTVNCSLLEDGTIAITQLSEAELFDLI